MSARFVVGLLNSCAIALAVIPGAAPLAVNVEVHSTSFLASDGVRLRILEAGPEPADHATARSLPVIAFVPGWAVPAAIWNKQLTGLGTTYRVAALDPRGQGESEIPSGGFNLERRSADLHEFISRYGHVVLVAWSLGALEALQSVYRHGNAAIDALVIVDSSVGEDPAPPPGGDFLEALRRDRRATVDGFVHGLFRSPRPQSELDALAAAAMRMPLEASLSLFPRTVPRKHWREITRSFTRPLLYVVTPQFAAQAENLRRHRPATRIAVFESAGHALFVDEPEQFNRLVAAFVGEIGRDSPDAPKRQ